MNEAASTGQSNTSSTSPQDKVTLTINTVSNSRVMVYFGGEIQNADGSDNQRTYARFTGTNVSLVGGNFETSTTGGWSSFEGQKLDISSHVGNRTYRLQWWKSSSNQGRIRNAYICAIEMSV